MSIYCIDLHVSALQAIISSTHAETFAPSLTRQFNESRVRPRGQMAMSYTPDLTPPQQVRRGAIYHHHR